MQFKGLMLNSSDPKKLSDFYTKILGKPGWQMDDYYGWTKTAGLMIGPHSEVKGKNELPARMMLSFETKDVKAEFKRVKEFGGKVIAEPYNPGEEKDMWLSTIADPDGNYIQISTPWEG